MTLLQYHVTACALTAVSTVVIGLIVYLADPKKRLNQVFALYSMAIAWWSGSEAFLVIQAGNERLVHVLLRFQWIGVSFIAPTFLHTILLLTDDRRKWTSRLLKAGYLAGAVFVAFHLFSNLFLTPALPIAYVKSFGRLTPLGLYLPAVFLVLVNVGLLRLCVAYHRANGQKRTQLKYLFWASVIGYVGGGADWAFPLGFYIPTLNPFGIYSVPCYSLATTYAVLHHKLFDVKVVIRKSLVYSLLVTSLTIGYFGLVYGIERLFQMTFGYKSVWLSLSAFALMALCFHPLKIGIQRLVDFLLFRAPHEELVRRMERLEQEVRQSEKLKAISTLAAGMAHEIKNPLTAIKTFAAYLPEKGSDAEFQKKFQRIVTQEVNKIDRIVREVLEFARPTPPKLESVQVSTLLDETLDFLSNDCVTHQIRVECSYGDGAEVIQADPQQLRQVFLNLFLNSLEAMNGNGGALSVSTARNSSSLSIAISDTGPGIPKEQLSRLFDPFFTTKAGGTGLGLSVVQGIVNDHRGSIKVESQERQGTTVRIELPLAGATS